MAQASTLTEEEQEDVYDRQVRLWGVEAQKRLCAARVVVLGLTPTLAEAAKGLALAGVRSIRIADDTPAASAPASLLKDGSAGSHAAAFARAISGSSAFCSVDAIAPSDALHEITSNQCEVALLSWRNRQYADDARAASVPCYVSGGASGVGAFFFVDTAQPECPGISKQLLFSPLPKDTPPIITAAVRVARRCSSDKRVAKEPDGHGAQHYSTADEDSLFQSLAKDGRLESPPTASVTGGVAGQEASKVVSGSGTPLQTAFAFDERKSNGAITDVSKLPNEASARA